MNDTPRTDAQKREDLRARITAAEDRNEARSLADQAKAAADGALEYVKANPLKSVAAVAAGALVIGALTRPGRRAGRKAGARVGSLAGVAADTVLAYGLSLLDSGKQVAGKGQDVLSDLGNTTRKNARAWQASAAREGSELSDYILGAAKRGSKRAGKTIDELRGRLSN